MPIYLKLAYWFTFLCPMVSFHPGFAMNIHHFRRSDNVVDLRHCFYRGYQKMRIVSRDNNLVICNRREAWIYNRKKQQLEIRGSKDGVFSPEAISCGSKRSVLNTWISNFTRAKDVYSCERFKTAFEGSRRSDEGKNSLYRKVAGTPLPPAQSPDEAEFVLCALIELTRIGSSKYSETAQVERIQGLLNSIK
jgi:hypothetical protein